MSELEQQAEQDPRLGTTVVHRRYVSHRDSHLAGDLVDSAYTLGMLGDAAVELCIRTDDDEGLFVGYAEVDFLEPVHGGDVIEAQAVLVRIGDSSREIAFEARVLCRSAEHLESRRPGVTSTSHVLDEPLVVVRATGTVVVE